MTSNGIFSDSATGPTGLDLSIRNWSSQGSTLMRPPSGSAATTLPAGFASASDCCAENTAEDMVQLVETLSPRCGLIRLGISFDRFLSAWRKSCAVRDCSLYGELFSSSIPFWFAACSSSGVRAKSKWRHAIHEAELRVHAMSQHHVTELVRQDGREAGFVRQHVNQTAAHDDRVA